MADHLSRIKQGEDKEDVPDAFPEEHLYFAQGSNGVISWKDVLYAANPLAFLNEVSKRQSEPWFADIAIYLVTGVLPYCTRGNQSPKVED